jgi:F-type H+/Na+-transporting ATPase subunit beta
VLPVSPIDRIHDQAIGTIVSVHGPVVVNAWDHLPPIRRALRAHVNDDTYLFEVHQHLDGHDARAITLHQSAGLRRGTPL